MKIIILILLIESCFLTKATPYNYIKNGDFENPKLLYQIYASVTAIPYWSGRFEIVGTLYAFNFTASQFVDLSYDWNGYIQQFVTLPYDGIYRLNFTGKSFAQALTDYDESKGEVYWNGVRVLVSFPLPKAMVFESVIVDGKKGGNHLKFVEVGSQNSRGLLVDNVFLELIKEKESYIETVKFQTKVRENSGVVQFTSNFTISSKQLLQIISQNIKISISLQRQLSYRIYIGVQSKLTLEVYPSRSYNLSTTQISVEVINTTLYFINLSFIIEEKNLIFYYFFRHEQKVFNITDPLGIKLVKFTKSAYTKIRASFCSYFLLSLINFWNLSLIFSFLNIKALPAFSRDLQQTLADIIFGQTSFINWICQMFKWNPEKFAIDHSYDRELLDNFKNGEKWFGSMEIISNCFANNLEVFILLCLLLFKLFLLKLFQCFIKGSALSLLFSKQNSKIIFLKQFISFQPFIIISAASCAFQPSSSNFKQKNNDFFQIVLLGFCSLTAPLIFVLHLKSAKNESKLMRKQKVGAFLNRAKVIRMYENFDHMLCFIIPFFAIINEPSLFLIVVSVVITAKAVFFIRQFKLLDQVDKVFEIFMNLIWIIIAASYVVLFFIDKLAKQDQRTLNIRKYLGFVIIGAVLAGGVIEAMKLVPSLLILIKKQFYKIIRSCIRKKKMRNKISPQDQANKTDPSQMQAERKPSLKKSNKHSKQQCKKQKNNKLPFSSSKIIKIAPK